MRSPRESVDAVLMGATTRSQAPEPLVERKICVCVEVEVEVEVCVGACIFENRNIR